MNKRRHAKSFPLAATAIIIAVAICAVSFAVKALMVKYQVIQGGNKLKQIEQELAVLNNKNEALQTRKEKLLSAPNLQAAIDKRILDLVPITPADIAQPSHPIAKEAPVNPLRKSLADTTRTSREDGR